MDRHHFKKLPTTIQDQITLLKTRGLLFPNEEFAHHCLSTVSYYRLSAYIKPFELDKTSHQLNPTVSFEDVWNLYVFDRELRLLFLDALERIEVALRTSLVNVMSSRYGAWWYFEKEPFKSSWFEIKPDRKRSPAEDFKYEVEALCSRNTSEGSIKHYYTKYKSPNFPPSWMLFEHLSFGKCTSIFRNLKHAKDKAEISKVFKIHAKIVESSIEPLRYTRNICAHHLRLWDRWFVYKPRQIEELANAGCQPGTLKEQMVLLMFFHYAISPHSGWKTRLYNLFEKHMIPGFPITLMGIDNDWKNDLLWTNSN